MQNSSPAKGGLEDLPHNASGHTDIGKMIKDEFTKLRLSRQRKYQLRMERDKRCIKCGEPAVQGSSCLKHLVQARERQRKKLGHKRRYQNTMSYRLQAATRKADVTAKVGRRKRPAR